MFTKMFENYKKIAMYSVIGIAVGIIIGIIDAIFGEVLIKITAFRDVHPIYLIPLLPIAGLSIVWMYRYYSKESLKGMTLVFQTGHGYNDYIPKMLVPLVIVSTWITHIFGGSAGREGVAVQLGAAVAHTIGRKLNFLENPRALLVIGMAAGFGGLFQTPLAATFFAVEVLVSGVFIYEVLLPCFIAAYVASTTSHLLGLEKFYVNIDGQIVISKEVLIKLMIIGIIFGITGACFAFFLDFSKKKLSSIIENPYKRIFITACILSILFLLLHMGRYSGLGTDIIAASFDGTRIYSYDWIIKLILTIVTLAAGFQGGEVTPLFAIGASLGVALSGIMGLPVLLVAALGYAAVFGSATNTLIAPILIGAEVFGPQNTIYFAIVCLVAFVFNGNKTIYTSQKKYAFFED